MIPTLALCLSAVTTGFGSVWFLSARLAQMATMLDTMQKQLVDVKDSVERLEDREREDIEARHDLAERVAKLEGWRKVK